jgi:rubrerythrin
MSMFKFSADEIFEMALQIESNGAKFYQRAAELQEDEQARSTLLELAAMEQDHEKTFAEMRSQLSAAERKEMVFDPEQELPLYLRAMADKNVFNVRVDPSERLTGKPKMEDVLRMAIGLEKDSIVFYLGMKEVVPERLGAARLDDIVKEEMGHIATLGELIRCARL